MPAYVAVCAREVSVKHSVRAILKRRIRSNRHKRDLELPEKGVMNAPRLDGNPAIQPAIQLSMLMATLAPLQPEDMLDDIPDLIAEAIVL